MADTAQRPGRRVGKLTALFDVFDPDGHAYGVGDVASYDGVLYRSGAGAQSRRRTGRRTRPPAL